MFIEREKEKGRNKEKKRDKMEKNIFTAVFGRLRRSGAPMIMYVALSYRQN